MVTSAVVFVEVCGVISRRVGVDNALLVRDHLVKWGDMNFIVFEFWLYNATSQQFGYHDCFVRVVDDFWNLGHVRKLGVILR